MTDRSDVIVRESRSAGSSSRRVLLRRAVTAAAAVPVLGGAMTVLAPAAGSATLTDRDREVLRFARMLEELQAAFYHAAIRSGRLSGEPLEFARTVGAQELAHLRYLRAELGDTPKPAAGYRFTGAFASNRSFVRAAVTLEQTGLAAYNGEAANVSRSTLRGLARVMSVEARHASWARAMAGEVPAPVAADVPISAATALRAIRPYLA